MLILFKNKEEHELIIHDYKVVAEESAVEKYKTVVRRVKSKNGKIRN